MVGVKISVERRVLPAIGATCLAAAALAVIPPAAVADTPTVQYVSGPDDSLPVPTYRPGPKGSNVPPPEQSEEKPTKYYTDCDQVRAEGKLPLYRGQPGYAPYLDPDGDGIACD